MHGHGAHAHRAQNRRRLLTALLLVAGYVVAEVVGGLLSNSLALLADAGHTFADMAALGLSLAALSIAERPPTSRRTYGYYRAEILAALANGVALVVIAVFVLVEAYARLREPEEVAGGIMMAVAWGGLVVNLIALRVLHGGKAESLNLRGAWLHVLNDTLGSVGTIVAAGSIWAFGWYWADPLISAVIALLVIYSAWTLLEESVAVLMESAPRGIDVDELRDALRGMPGVTAVHDLHVWTITTGIDALSVHVVTQDHQPAAELLGEIREMVHDRFGIHQVTVQLEPEGFEARHRCGHGATSAEPNLTNE